MSPENIACPKEHLELSLNTLNLLGFNQRSKIIYVCIYVYVYMYVFYISHIYHICIYEI
jgi:hypothetical protein